MRERITYWKCPKCFGTGKCVQGFEPNARTYDCEACDGTGNGMVDGATERHKRRVAKIERRQLSQ